MYLPQNTQRRVSPVVFSKALMQLAKPLSSKLNSRSGNRQGKPYRRVKHGFENSVKELDKGSTAPRDRARGIAFPGERTFLLTEDHAHGAYIPSIRVTKYCTRKFM